MRQLLSQLYHCLPSDRSDREPLFTFPNSLFLIIIHNLQLIQPWRCTCVMLIGNRMENIFSVVDNIMDKKIQTHEYTRCTCANENFTMMMMWMAYYDVEADEFLQSWINCNVTKQTAKSINSNTKQNNLFNILTQVFLFLYIWFYIFSFIYLILYI